MLQTENQSEPAKRLSDHQEDEIELIDLLRVIWKWKYLIMGGTLACAIVAMVISTIMPKIYRIETIIRPGILRFSEDGESVYIDTPENIKALIETGAFGKKILDVLAESNTPDIPKELKFKVTLPSSSSTLKINWDTQHVEQGITILKLLGKFLMEEYGNLVGYFQNEIDRDINIEKAGIQKISTMKQSHETNIENIVKRIQELETEIVIINKNTDYLNKERNNLLSKGKDENNILSVILYSNTIQQNLQLANDYKNEIKDLKLRKETESQLMSELENELQKRVAEIENLTIKKSNIQNIQIVQQPYSSKYPVKPKKMLNVILAVFIGIFAMICLAFLFEYISRNKERKYI
jgi:LPS O-antigen subunit length determinant protein (WzzB/FepE family)